MIHGVHGKPFLDASPLFPEEARRMIHEEICLALTTLPLGVTGGSHRSLGITPEAFAASCGVDYGEVIAAMSDDELRVFHALADDPSLLRPGQRDGFGEDQPHSLSLRQARWLEYRFKVYFPWKIYYELLPGGRWADKANPRGKAWTRAALMHLPRTVMFLRQLPFDHLGSVKLLGLSSFDHGTVHRDGDPETQESPDEFLTLCPAGDKRLFVWDQETGEEHAAPATAYWFNDHDWHGVSAAPYFRYSLRVDGRFSDSLRRWFAEAAAC